MASSFSTDLKLELMVTGENAGLWGDITNTNLNILQQSIAGYESVALNATTGATLAFTNGAISNGKNAVLNLTGTLTSSVNVVVPDAGSGTAPEKVYLVKNSTSGAFAVTFKTTSGTGATFAAADKGIKILYSDGTNITDVNANFSASSFPQINDTNGNEELKFTATSSAVNEITITNAATGNRPNIAVTGDDTNIGLSVSTKGTGLVLFNDGAYNADATLTDGATITWDVGSSPVAKVTLGDNRTLSAPTNSAAGQFISIAVIQDGTGSRTLTWNSAYEFTGDVAPTLTTTANKADIFVFKYNGTVWLEVGRNLNLSIS
jgi:hypothetical protein